MGLSVCIWLFSNLLQENIFPFELNRTDSKLRQSWRDLMLGSYTPFSFRCDNQDPFYISNSCLSVWIIVNYLDPISLCTLKSRITATWVFLHKIIHCFRGILLLLSCFWHEWAQPRLVPTPALVSLLIQVKQLIDTGLTGLRAAVSGTTPQHRTIVME